MSIIESTVCLFKEALFDALHDWILHHAEVLNPKWYTFMVEKEKKAWDSCRNAIDVMGTAMWAFNMIANCGVLAGLGPDGPKIHEIPKEFDEARTKRLLLLMSACMNLQYLPPELAKAPIPEGKGPPWRFSLLKFAMERAKERVH